MPNEVITSCPQCDSEIPFYRTVDELRQCPECGTPSDILFDIAIKRHQQTAAAAVADGGVVDDE